MKTIRRLDFRNFWRICGRSGDVDVNCKQRPIQSGFDGCQHAAGIRKLQLGTCIINVPSYFYHFLK